MAQGRGRDAWSRTSALMALIANVNRDPKKTRAFKPSDFDPYADKKQGRIVVNKENISVLRNLFIGGTQNEHGV
ncbi:MAG: hypothetical protein A2Y07_06870 [Planctomycetes bacterium GWF2_50_10]|nr:MAG: hypothetical protein A2Y07_06870 [Planctomycetes bacterium GWF2_50_10]